MKKNINIALIAHDNRKDDLIKWVLSHKAELSIHNLCGTGTTSKRVADATGLQVKGYMSGPLGGDQQIGAAIAQREIDMLIFFWDPLTSQPHDPDVKALLRIAVLYDIPTASNPSTADLMLIALANKER
ncbi:MAG: methylglyoxal synthase [Firmicutes bacterium HGW-Firmicutes-20]|jgi:methylglyoxal synthase|nr:MAG: methylglyoxal synthase [Firmicutes bacterium HGW-Firmicutes-20]PKM66894.1 MAG: methylglyoxal synthase [Firmicutes bacterium HGW-Firmicutes-19]